MGDFYKGLSEKEARLMLAPLAAAVMLASPESRESMVMTDGQPYEPWKVVRDYESILDLFYRSFTAIHD